jgi:hypothetical protein
MIGKGGDGRHVKKSEGLAPYNLIRLGGKRKQLKGTLAASVEGDVMRFQDLLMEVPKANTITVGLKATCEVEMFQAVLIEMPDLDF